VFSDCAPYARKLLFHAVHAYNAVPSLIGAGIHMTVQRLALVTDAWHPQTNGVVNTLTRVTKHLRAQGTEVLVVSPEGHRTLPMPCYPEIRLTCDPWHAIKRIRAFRPQALHIATEGPLGVWASRWCWKRGFRFTSSFHTRFPEYLCARFPSVPLAFGYGVERWFHGRAEHTLVGTRSLIRELRAKGVGRRLVHWPRGVDTATFHPMFRRQDVYDLPRPIWLYVGRVSFEKSLEDFLSLPLPGTKVVVGDGPSRAELQARFPEAVWRGFLYGRELSEHYASADCFVFPSRTETFGNVLLEALASGLPVASVPAPGPIDLVEEGVNGAIDERLFEACQRALLCSRTSARASSDTYTLRASHQLFTSHLVPLSRRLPATSGAQAQAC
jgi:glycosyltransferase involved in cell wall biosynthesis